MKHAQAEVSECQGRIVGQRGVDREGDKARRDKGQPLEPPPIEDGEVIGMHGNRRAGFLLEGRHAPDVIDMPMRHQDPLDRQALLTDVVQDTIDLQARVDGQRSLGVAPPDQIAVLAEEIVGERRYRELFAKRFRRRHPTPTSADAGVRTSGPSSVMSSISSSRTPPQPGT